jgi:NAD-dependent dihydropyrimidine dehydrogenase PreA subunit
MYIDNTLCQNCANCIPVCPVGAIVVTDKKVTIDYEACVECGVCRRLAICPEEAIRQVPEIPYPRIIRAAFSDPTHRHETTEVLGRGTEEMKTNDVKNEFTSDIIGFSIELGRPGVGAYLIDLDKVTRKAVSLGGTFADYNPVIALMADRKTGRLKTEVLREKVLSAIAEFMVPSQRALEVLAEMIRFLNVEIDTVATVSIISRHPDDGSHLFYELLKDHGHRFGYFPYPNGKVNIGMASIT